MEQPWGKDDAELFSGNRVPVPYPCPSLCSFLAQPNRILSPLVDPIPSAVFHQVSVGKMEWWQPFSHGFTQQIFIFFIS